MSTPEKPNDPSSARTEKLPAGTEPAAADAPAESRRHGLSEQTQKALLAVTSGVALVLSIIALVVAIAGGDHHGRGDGHGPMGGPHMEQRGGPMMRGPQGGPPQGANPDLAAPGQPRDQQDGGARQGTGTTTSPNN